MYIWMRLVDKPVSSGVDDFACRVVGVGHVYHMGRFESGCGRVDVPYS